MSQETKTQQLMDELVAGLRPASPLPSVRARLMRWCLFTAILLGACTAIAGARPDLGLAIREPWFVVETLVLAIFAVLSAYLALRSGTPGEDKLDRREKAALAGIAATWLGLILYSDWTAIRLGVAELVWDSLCGLSIVIVGSIPTWYMFRHLRAAAPVNHLLSGALAATAAAASVCFCLQFVCYDKAPLHFLVWHFTMTGAVVLLGMRAGARFLRW